MRDVARQAGVSLSTVSRVLNDDPNVSRSVADKVHHAIDNLHYERTRTKGTSRSASLIGLVIPNILNPFFPLLIRGIERRAKTQGYNIILCDSEDDVDTETRNIERLIEIGVDGLVFIASKATTPKVESLVREQFPIVFVDRTIANDHICCITIDNEEGAYQAVKYLLKLGHKRIVYLAGPDELSTERERFDGYKRALEEESIDFQEGLVLRGGFHFDRAYEEVNTLLERKVPFTAVFSAADIMAFGAIKALTERGLRIPEDVSLVGYDDIPFSSSASLTTVAQPVSEMGSNAVITLIDLITGKTKPPYRLVLRPSLVIRASCRRL